MKPEFQLHELTTLCAASLVAEMDKNPPDTEEDFCLFLDAYKKELYAEIQQLMGQPH